MLTKIINTVTNVLFIVSSSLFIFIIVRQGAPGKILPRAANWPGPAPDYSNTIVNFHKGLCIVII